jgi:hypothetical protein
MPNFEAVRWARTGHDIRRRFSAVTTQPSHSLGAGLALCIDCAVRVQDRGRPKSSSGKMRETPLIAGYSLRLSILTPRAHEKGGTRSVVRAILAPPSKESTLAIELPKPTTVDEVEAHNRIVRQPSTDRACYRKVCARCDAEGKFAPHDLRRRDLRLIVEHSVLCVTVWLAGSLPPSKTPAWTKLPM